jgi:hypothetical protein
VDARDAEERNRVLEQRIADLEALVRYLGRQLARFGPASGNALSACRILSPEGPRLVVAVRRNNEPCGEVVLAHGDWSASPGLPGLLRSEIALAYCRDNVLFGTATLGGDTYAWGEKPSLPPP